MKKRLCLFIIFFLFFWRLSNSQEFYYLDNGIYHYFVGTSQPPADWKSPDFDDSGWNIGHNSIGYGDGDDSTIIPKTTSVYLRIHFNVPENYTQSNLNLIVDFDDGFISYMNGTEIARVNLGKIGENVNYNTLTDRSHEALFYRYYYNPVIGYYIDSTVLKTCLVTGANVLSVEVHNDSIIGSDLSFVSYLMNTTSYPNYDYYDMLCRYKRPIQLDSSKFPIVVIETDEYGIDSSHVRVPAHMGIINNGIGAKNTPDDNFNNYNGKIAIELRGESSRDFTKRSYNIETQTSAGKNLNVSILGMPAENDWVLFGPFADKSQIRNEIMFTLGRKMGYYEPRTRFCEMILDGEFQGLYIMTEKIKRDSNRVDISKLKPDELEGDAVTGGYVIKYDKPTSGYVQFVYPDRDSVAPEQRQYIQGYFTSLYNLLKTPDLADPVLGYRMYIDPKSLIDYVVVNELCKNADSYLYSTYMYKDRVNHDGRIKYGPLWDYDLAFGNTLFQNGDRTTGWQFAINGSLRIIYMMRDTVLTREFKDRWFELRKTFLSTDSLLDLIDSLVNSVKDARIRNYQVWPVIDKTIFYPNPVMNATSYDQDIEFMKTWLLARLDWIDNNISTIFYPLAVPEPGIFANSNEDDFNIYPNPFKDNITVEINLKSSQNLRFDVYDVAGRRVSQIPETFFEAGSYPVNINLDVPQGIYMLSITSEGKNICTRKLVKW